MPDPQKQTVPRLPIIRLDLLETGLDDTGRTIRDIFSPKPAVEAADPGERFHLPDPLALDREAPEMDDISYRQPVFLTYMGYVAAGPVHIALVVYQGQPMAVGEGEEIEPGIRVIRITSESLEVQQPDSEIRVFPIEGESL